MPERTSYAHGVPSWADVASPDVDASAAFYGELFGWEHMQGENAEETGGYGMFAMDGKLVAGIGPLQNPQQPPVWSTYVNVDSADDAVAKATAAGGQVAMPPMDVMDAGRMAFLIDPGGAFIGVWQAEKHHGAELVGEPGTVGWSELATREPDAARTFYPAVFGWEPADWGPEGVEYTLWNVDGQPVGGMMAMGDRYPAEVPAHWARTSSSRTPTRPRRRRTTSAAPSSSRPSTPPMSDASRCSPTPTAPPSPS
jgi:predicted enzyme related to lactoylglutathione lyase